VSVVATQKAESLLPAKRTADGVPVEKASTDGSTKTTDEAVAAIARATVQEPITEQSSDTGAVVKATTVIEEASVEEKDAGTVASENREMSAQEKSMGDVAPETVENIATKQEPVDA